MWLLYEAKDQSPVGQTWVVWWRHCNVSSHSQISVCPVFLHC